MLLHNLKLAIRQLLKYRLQTLFLCLFPLSLLAQVDSTHLFRLRDFALNIATFNRLYPQEKVWLHCDNTAYFQGDTIWFAAYITSAETLRPVELSKVLYVELLDEAGEVVSTQRLPIENGHCHGQIPLNTELEKRFVNDVQQSVFYPTNRRSGNYYIPLPSGFYEVRAYTRAMLNWGSDVCFSRVFPVFDTPKREGDYSQLTMENREKKQRDLIENRIRPKTTKEERLNVDFYPEGGNIVRGLPCRVAYKVTDKEGRNLHAHCQLLADGDPITASETIHDGMGNFSLLPQGGVKYKLRVETDQYSRTFNLPETQPQGVMLTVDALRKDSIQMAIAATDSLLHKAIGMSITCRGKLLQFNAYSLSNRPTRLPAIAKNTLSPGVNQVTLFDANGQVYAERLFFVHDTTIVGKEVVEYLLDKTEYQPFEKINLTLQSHKGREWVSLSVRDANTDIGTTYSDNLQSYLLLSSDLKGYIHRPDYYFEADDSVHRTALDLLMMTQGWRRYAWKQLAGVEKFEKTHFVEEGLVIQGQIKSPGKREKGLNNIKVGATVFKDKNIIQKGEMKTDEEGCFTFIMEPFIGRHSLSINLTNKNNELIDGRILLHRHFSPLPKEYLFQEKEILFTPQPPQGESGAFSFTGDNLLGDVQVGRNRRQFEPFTLHNIKEEREKALDLGDNIFLTTTIENYIEEKYLPFSDEILWSIKVGSNYEDYQHLISLQDLKKSNKNIQDYELRNVDYIQVYHRAFSHTNIRWAIPLSQNEQNKQWIHISNFIYKKPKTIKGLRTTHIDGYSEIIDYYHPQYNYEIISGEVDYRRTLYWNPCVILDSKGKAEATFYNNSTCKQPTISIETLTE